MRISAPTVAVNALRFYCLQIPDPNVTLYVNLSRLNRKIDFDWKKDGWDLKEGHIKFYRQNFT